MMQDTPLIQDFTPKAFWAGIGEIERALECWREHSPTPYHSLRVYSPAQFVQLQKVCLQTCIPYGLLGHSSMTQTAQEKQIHLFPIHIQKSVTIKRDNKFYLISGLDDFLISPALLNILDERMEMTLSNKKRKNCSINPQTPSPEYLCGLAPGIVSPFFPPTHNVRYSGVLCLPFSAERHSLCAISLSRQSSLVIFSSHLKKLIGAYRDRSFPSLPLFFEDEEKTEENA